MRRRGSSSQTPGLLGGAVEDMAEDKQDRKISDGPPPPPPSPPPPPLQHQSSADLGHGLHPRHQQVGLAVSLIQLISKGTIYYPRPPAPPPPAALAQPGPARQ